ncbi:tetratricopeptide repeat-containing sensor histidine kinase [Flavobacterium hibernum]|uniref:histidine kinase n=1 Tax=Flavobacterium hibernum TaxID=37752 RepID=A0A0D0EWQ4_9FLAO|nr:ATP-binding protein [Flavobacterium hibernum]KIO53403.1 histidine kinase [Flavobacterium hibernum]OXA88005.1 ATP-binding protein [Flavobacterium hibernum]STO10601.1 Sensor protein degS [Flavobacterium hibernum]
MLRSPFFFIFIFLSLISCKEKTTVLIKPNNFKKEAKTLQEIGLNELQKSNYDSAFYNFNKSKVLFESSKDSSNIVFSLLQMANIQQVNSDYYGSKETLTEALPYVKNDNNYIVALNNLFGIADKELFIYDDAISYYNQAVKEAKDEVSKQSPLNNIAVIYIKQQKYDKAIELLESILKTKALDEFVKSKARVIDNLGFAYFKKGLNDKGIQLLNEGLKLRTEANDDYGIIGSYLHLAEFFEKTDIKKSNQYAKIAYETATKLNSVDERLRALSLLISSNSGTQYAQKYVSINDSIIRIRNNFKNKFAKIKYDSKKEKDENQKLRLEKVENEVALQKSEIEKISFLSGFIILGLVLFFVKKNHKNKAQIIKLETAYDTETRIAKNIHDELANDVFQAITFTQTQSLTNEDSKENLIQKLDHIYSRVRGISRENNDIDTGPNYWKNLKEILSTYNNDDTNISINGIEKINWDTIDDIKKISIHRVLQELMVNMKKHSQASVVFFKFEIIANNIVINYSDNGKGCVKEQIKKNGLQNMENRIIAVKGTITFDTEPDKGFKVKITLPK